MACKRSAVRSRLPPPSGTDENAVSRSPSSRGLGHHPFTVSTGVRIPVGTPGLPGSGRSSTLSAPGGYSSAGRALAWHARGQRFDPAYLHHNETNKSKNLLLFELVREKPLAKPDDFSGKSERKTVEFCGLLKSSGPHRLEA